MHKTDLARLQLEEPKLLNDHHRHVYLLKVHAAERKQHIVDCTVNAKNYMDRLEAMVDVTVNYFVTTTQKYAIVE